MSGQKSTSSTKVAKLDNLKVALVCDWLTDIGGAERVLLSIHQLFPNAPIYTSQYNPKNIDWFRNADVRTGWLQIFPAKMRRLLAPLRQRYFSHLDLSAYDLIISVTGAEAKAVNFQRQNSSQQPIHLCYCHIPTQYYWQMYDDYVKNPGFGTLNFLVRPFFKLFVNKLRRADYTSAQKPTAFITISQYSAAQIKRFYHRDATIIPPPVAVEKFMQSPTSKTSKSNPLVQDLPTKPYFINFSRQVSWKRLDLAIRACKQTGRHLVLIGDGPEHSTLVRLAGDTNLITFLPATDQTHLKVYLERASAFLFPSLEPFGIAPVEALSAGVPVIAYGKGGAVDYIKEGQNGLLFSEQTTKSLAQAIQRFSQLKFNPHTVTKTATYYREERFQVELKEYIYGYHS